MRKGTTAVARHRQEESSRMLAPKEIAMEIVDPKTKKKYLRGKFLGKVSNLKSLTRSSEIRNRVDQSSRVYLEWEYKCAVRASSI